MGAVVKNVLVDLVGHRNDVELEAEIAYVFQP
jgi:hypothetical protein